MVSLILPFTFLLSFSTIQSMILYINTKDSKVITVALKNKGEIVDSETDHNEFGSQVLLPLVEKVLEKNTVTYKDLKGVEVETGPGSYTGLKVGVAVANAIGFALNIPINGKKIETDLHYQ
jgi:tRNA threonylcarbamoyladenosine biosynthesis protein TsaB